MIPAPGREHSDLQGRKGLAVLVPGFELPSAGAGHQQDPCAPVPSPVRFPSQPVPGLGRSRFPVPAPALPSVNCVTLGRSFHLSRLFLDTHKVLSCARDLLHFQVTITRGSALWAPYRHWAGEGSAFPVYGLGRRGHSHLPSTIKVRSERHRPS